MKGITSIIYYLNTIVLKEATMFVERAYKFSH